MVSHVMPVWQPDPEWLRQAVGSALDQDALHELIVVDDGNPVPVAELLQDIADPRLVVIRVQHGGVSAARNAGIAHASGRAFRFVDDDDLLEPGSSGELLRLSGDEGTIAYGSTLVCDPELRPLRTIESELGGDIAIDCLLGRLECRLPSMLFPRPVVEQVGGFDPGLRTQEDWDFVLRALEHAPARSGLAVMTRYRRHDASATARSDPAMASSYRVVSKYFERHREQQGTPLERQAHARLHLVRAGALLFHRRYPAFVRELASAARTEPRAAAPLAGRAVRQIVRGAGGRPATRVRSLIRQ